MIRSTILAVTNGVHGATAVSATYEFAPFENFITPSEGATVF